jgi:hypothetical protein
LWKYSSFDGYHTFFISIFYFSDDRKDGILEVGAEFSGDEADPDYTEYMTGKKIPLGEYRYR